MWWHTTDGSGRRKLSNAMGRQYTSHYLRSWCFQDYYRWCAHLSCQHSTELTATSRFKETRPFGRKDEISFLRVCHHITACSSDVRDARQSALVHCCLQTVCSTCVGTYRTWIWRHKFLSKVKISGVFTQWQTQRHISRDSHCHLPVVYGGEFVVVKPSPKFRRPTKIMSKSTRFAKSVTNCCTVTCMEKKSTLTCMEKKSSKITLAIRIRKLYYTNWNFWYQITAASRTYE